MSSAGTSAFECPTCGAQYKVVRVEAESVSANQQLVCRKCGGPLHGRDGRFILKYFLVDRPRRRALGARGAKSIGLCRKDRHEGASWPMSRGCHTGPAICPHCSLSHDSFLSSTSASLVRGSFRFRPFSPLRLADAGVCPGMSGNLRPRLASSSSSSPFRIGHRVSALESFWRPGATSGTERARQSACSA